MPYSITRSIEIDMGHRIPTHGSKCWNLHGHRYKIYATVQSSTLINEGEQSGMVLDFSFLKNAMMGQIHDFCDHGLCLWVRDPWLPTFIKRRHHLAVCEEVVKTQEYFYVDESKIEEQTKLLIIGTLPTAEALAEFWFKRMIAGILQLSGGKAHLTQVTVFETPNCWAAYPANMLSLPSSTHYYAGHEVGAGDGDTHVA